MDVRQGILSTSQALGIDPLDLATAISYETAGTFDPTKRGPTTQWGQHRGLIQFGEPQSKQYGVDWENPVASQLGPEGAVAKYLSDTGVKPGMGLLDIYSAINAGGVGRYNRSDANNGGAPGTVRDKVEQQMAAHRSKAQALLGGGGRAAATGNQGNDMVKQQQSGQTAQRMQKTAQRGSGLLGDIIGPDKRDRLIMALEGMTLNPNQALMQQAGQSIAQRREQASKGKQRSATADWLEKKGHVDLANGVRGGAIPAAAALQQAMAKPAGPKFKEVGGRLVQINPDGSVSEAYAPPSEDGFNQVRGSDLGLEGEDASRLFNVAPDGKITSIGGGGQTINVGPKDSSVYGEPPTGTTWVLDENGEHVMEEVNGDTRPKIVPLAGSAAEERLRKSEESGEEGSNRASTRAKVSSTAVDELGMLLSGLGVDPETGEVGDSKIGGPRTRATVGSGEDQSRLSGILFGGTETVDWLNTLQSLQDTIAIDRLLEIKAAGSGLGQVPQSQLRALARAMGNLDANSSDELLRDNLLRVKYIYEDVLRQSLEDKNDPTFRGVISNVAPDAEVFDGDKPAPSGDNSGGAPTRKRFNPETGAFE